MLSTSRPGGGVFVLLIVAGDDPETQASVVTNRSTLRRQLDVMLSYKNTMTARSHEEQAELLGC